MLEVKCDLCGHSYQVAANKEENKLFSTHGSKIYSPIGHPQRAGSLIKAVPFDCGRHLDFCEFCLIDVEQLGIKNYEEMQLYIEKRREEQRR